MSTPDPLNTPSTTPGPSPWAPPTAVPPPPSWSATAGVQGAAHGYVPYAATGAVRSSRGLVTATLTLYWCRTAAEAFLAVAFAKRRSVIDSAIDHFHRGGVTQSDVDADDRARALIGGASVLLLALTLAAAIVTSLWARRAAENARARGDRLVRPGLATGGWYIPIGWFWVGFNQIKQAVSRAGHNPRPIGRWQTAFVLASVLSGFTFRFDGNGNSLDSLKTASTTGLTASVISLGLFAWCTIAAGKALRATTDALG